VLVEEEADVEAAVEETSSSGVYGSEGEQRSRQRWNRQRQRLREFWDESEMTQSRLLFIGSKISAMVLNQNRC
jgi:hypothetical protein